jgi:hypothetical protein
VQIFLIIDVRAVRDYLGCMRQDTSITIRISARQLRDLDNLRIMESQNPLKIPTRAEILRRLIDREVEQRACHPDARHLEWGELVDGG